MKAILLAAGVGNRLEEKGKEIPKCLIKVGNETLLQRQKRILNELNIHEIILVAGSKGDCWTKENLEKIREVHNEVIINDKNMDLKRPYSIYHGLKGIRKDDLIIIDGDLFFEKKLIKNLLENKRKNLFLSKYVESKNLKNKGAKIISNKEGIILKMGYGFPSNKLFAGIFKISEEDFDVFKKILSIPENWEKNFSDLVNQFSKSIDFYNLTINPVIPIIVKKENQNMESFKPAQNYLKKIENIIRKKTKNNKQKLINEVNFIKNLPEDLKKYFPRIVDYDFKEEFAFYDMVYCPYPPFIDLILNKEINSETSLEILKTIFDFVFNKLYKLNIKKTPVGFIRESYFNKIEKRLNASKNKCYLFDKIVNSDYLIINGKKMKNFHIILDEIKKDIKFMAKLEPPFVNSYHGDFKFDNMLINPETKDFVLIDPRGKTAVGHDESDLIEDLAKLFTSCHAYYDLFRKDLFNLKIDTNKEIIVDYKIKEEAEEIKFFFENITKKLIYLFPNYTQIKNDENWQTRLYFIESMLLIANAPFHLTSKENEKFSIALLVRGIELLNKFVEKYPLNQEEKFNIININLLEDYSLIKTLFK